MGFSASYCNICGTQPDDNCYMLYMDNESCECHTKECEACAYVMPEEDRDFMKNVRLIFEDGTVSGVGEGNDWPGFAVILNDGTRVYSDINLRGGDEKVGLMLHTVCFDLLNSVLLSKNITYQQVFDWYYDNCEEDDFSWQIFLKFDLGFVSQRQEQEYVLYKGEEWVTRRPDVLPPIPDLDPKAVGEHTTHPYVFEIVLLELYITDVDTLFQLELTCRYFHHFLSSYQAQCYLWKKVCMLNHMIIDPTICEQLKDWRKYAFLCQQHPNYRNRARIMGIIDRIVNQF